MRVLLDELVNLLRINNFDRCPYQSSTRSDEEDVTKVVGVVKRNKLLDFIPGRAHAAYIPLEKTTSAALDSKQTMCKD